jgi:hypothetical protein
MYTLIITVVLYGFDYRSAGSPTITSVSGFSTEQACNNAKAKVLSDTIPNGSYQTTVTKAVCIAMDV